MPAPVAYRDARPSDAHSAPSTAPAGAAPQPGALAQARANYQEFLSLWKDADRDIPLLKQPKAEYATLEAVRLNHSR